MRTRKSLTVLIGMVVLAGCSSFKHHPTSYIKQPTVCIDTKWYGYYQGSGCPSTAKAAAPDATKEMADRLAALEQTANGWPTNWKQHGKKMSLSSRVNELERQLADRDRELMPLLTVPVLRDSAALSGQGYSAVTE